MSTHEPFCPLPAEMAKSPEFRRYGVYCTCHQTLEVLRRRYRGVLNPLIKQIEKELDAALDAEPGRGGTE